MQVIPVIDVRGGMTVAAVRGDRAHYAPLATPLAASAAPDDVARGLVALFPFGTLYVADLDGIEGRGADLATQRRLADTWSGDEIWIDDGASGAGRSTETAAEGEPPSAVRRCPVLGSESIASLADYETARRQAGPHAPLSLDFRGDTFIGPPELFESAAIWPRRIIVMTLARVGSAEGPDLARLASIIARAGDRQVFAAGGVRHAADLDALRDIGAAGALIATALHAGRITRGDLERLHTAT